MCMHVHAVAVAMAAGATAVNQEASGREGGWEGICAAPMAAMALEVAGSREGGRAYMQHWQYQYWRQRQWQQGQHQHHHQGDEQAGMSMDKQGHAQTGKNEQEWV